MVVFDAVDVVLHVHGERHSIQTLFTHHAAETAGMVGLAESLEDLDAHEGDRERREGGRPRRRAASKEAHLGTETQTVLNEYCASILVIGQEKIKQ